MVNITSLAFLLQGRVQKVKMRRYVESAAKHFELGGYVVNTEDGHVFGEAWVCDDKNRPSLRGFRTWIRGEWEPAVFTNVKPTPVGTAYPEKALVDRGVVTLEESSASHHYDVSLDHVNQFLSFTMVRDDNQSAMLQSERRHVLERLLRAADDTEGTKDDSSMEVFAWPPPR
jgi:acylphosphatase